MREDKRFSGSRSYGTALEDHLVRALACLAVLVASCSMFPGCALFGKKGSDSKTPATGGAAPAKFPTSSDPLLNGGNASQNYGGAVLAGRVIDNYSRPPASTSIQVVSMESKDAGKPAEVNAGPDGYFTVQGLKPGVSYKLVARGKNGDHILAGITQTRAPNVTLVILVREDFAGSVDGQGVPGSQDKKKAGLDGPNNFANTNNAGANGEFELPAAVNVPDPGKPNPAAVDPSVAADRWSPYPPTLEIPNPTTRMPLPPLQIQSPALPPLGNPTESRLEHSARVPSCVRVGNQLINFALNDVNGTPWEFKRDRDRKSKLFLIDFWGTWCVPCKKTVPSLAKLQGMYRQYGLEVIGIALEQSGTPAEKGYKVSRTAGSLNANYRQLLSIGEDCPVVKNLRVESIPTMILVDQDGTILWTHTKEPTLAKLNELERLIRMRLNLQ